MDAVNHTRDKGKKCPHQRILWRAKSLNDAKFQKKELSSPRIEHNGGLRTFYPCQHNPSI